MGGEIDIVKAVADSVRVLFLKILETSLHTQNTAGACGYACALAKHSFDHFTEFKAYMRGGDGQGDGGFIDSAGRQHGHYWLEVVGDQSYIVDITADQFGLPPVVVFPADQADQYSAGRQDIVDGHAREFCLVD